MQKFDRKLNKNSNTYTEHETLFLEGKNKDPNIIGKPICQLPQKKISC